MSYPTFRGFVLEQDPALNDKLWEALRYSVFNMLPAKTKAENKVSVQIIIEPLDKE